MAVGISTIFLISETEIMKMMLRLHLDLVVCFWKVFFESHVLNLDFRPLCRNVRIIIIIIFYLFIYFCDTILNRKD